MVAATGHADVRGGGARGLTDDQVRTFHRLALRAVDGGGVGQLEVGPARSPAGRVRASPATLDRHLAVGIDARDGPLVPVGHVEVTVVTAAADRVPEPPPAHPPPW